MENTTPIEIPVHIDGQWNMKNPDDFKEMETYFKSFPDFRIMEYCGKFFIQIKQPNYQEVYTKQEQCFCYAIITEPYFKNEFYSLEDAMEFYQLYRTKPTYHTIIEQQTEEDPEEDEITE